MLGPAETRLTVEQSSAVKKNPVVGWLAHCLLVLAAAGLMAAPGKLAGWLAGYLRD